MCGICGIIDFNEEPVNEMSIRSMMMMMKHRGPDDEGVFLERNIGVGFVRLSIIDLSHDANQPMISGDSRYIIVFNGEIYNYLELKDELIKAGYSFRTKTDTEVLLTSYIHWGEACMDHFNGMWAFVIYDRLKQEVFGCRDRFGVKPFYYYIGNRKFIFASDIPPILAAISDKPRMNEEVVFDYLVFNRTDQSDDTFFNKIKKLQHGHSFRMNLSGENFTIRKWYDLRTAIVQTRISYSDYYNLFKSSVELRLRSDVPVGVCLSGGIDSSAIVSTLLKLNGSDNIKTFSAIYGKGKSGDESEYINEYKTVLQNMFYVNPDADSFLRDLPVFIKAHSEPVPTSSPYAQFKVMELARNHVVVTLDGQGADEQLAGYNYFYGFYFRELLVNLAWKNLIREITLYLKNGSEKGISYFLYFLLPGIIKKRFKVLQTSYLSAEFRNKYIRGSTVTEKTHSSGSLHEALFDHFEYKLEHLLKWEDRNSMWFSLEARTPFLDYRLVEQTLSLPSSEILNRGISKFILRKATEGIVPEKIRNRKDKIGFGTPQDEWFRSENFCSYVNDILDSDYLKSTGIVDIEKAKGLFKRHLSGDINISNDIWKWINLDLWLRKYIN